MDSRAPKPKDAVPTSAESRRRRWPTAFLSLLAATILCVAAPAQHFGWTKLVEGPLTVHVPQGSARDPLVLEVIQEFPGIMQEVARSLSLEPPQEVAIYVCPDLDAVESFTLESVPVWMAALAQPHRGRLFLRTDRIPEGDRRALHELLKHESAHLVMGSLPKHVFDKLPLWFHEGVAQKYAGHLFQFSWDELARRVRPMESPSLDDLEEEFPRTEYEAHTAYLYSEAIVGLMMRLWGSDVVPRILTELETRNSFSAAVFAVTGRPVIWHEKRLHEELASDRTVLVRFLYGVFGGLCFLSMIPFLIVGVHRSRRKRRTMHEQWEREEREQDEQERPEEGDEASSVARRNEDSEGP